MGIKLIFRKEERKKGQLWFPVFLWGGFFVDLKMAKAVKWIKAGEFAREASNEPKLYYIATRKDSCLYFVFYK
ncbi:hypothetical protein CBW16_00015 [Flavobacteriaceae bacterium JJC]|nr:hypothetical protein CBW16_00015 [Flavobacteriaceae bacterium JJC]